MLNRSEVTDILGTVTNLKHKTILYMVYSSGLRVGEVVRLKTGDIDMERMMVKVNQGKGKKDSSVKYAERGRASCAPYSGWDVGVS